MRADARKRIGTVTPIRRTRLTPLIGMIGKKRSGKDSFAATLVEEYGFTRYAFADPLKEAALALNPIIGAGFGGVDAYLDSRIVHTRLSDVVTRYGWEIAKEVPEVRRTLQNYGVAIREIDPGFWIRATLTPALAHPGAVVVTDVRFPNEAEAIRNAGGKIVRVTRPGLASDDMHVSETALDDYVADVTVANTGTLEDLAVEARALF